MTAQEQAPARPGRIPPDWTGGRMTREAVLAETGDEALAQWCAASFPHGDFALYGAREDYRRHLAEEQARRDGVALTRQDMRVLVSLLAAKGISQSASGEIAVRNCGRQLTALAARLKVLADMPAAGYRLTAGDGA